MSQGKIYPDLASGSVIGGVAKAATRALLSEA
jgi:hypothetical protein